MKQPMELPYSPIRVLYHGPKYNPTIVKHLPDGTDIDLFDECAHHAYVIDRFAGHCSAHRRKIRSIRYREIGLKTRWRSR